MLAAPAGAARKELGGKIKRRDEIPRNNFFGNEAKWAILRPPPWLALHDTERVLESTIQIRSLRVLIWETVF